MKGLIIKGIGGFYFVETEEGVFRAKGRGLFKKDKDILMVGDNVEVEPPEGDEDDGVITSILPRKNSFHRPPISNVDILIVTMAVNNPYPVPEVTDGLLVMAEKNNIEAIVCINKCDLGTREEVDALKSIYSEIYPTVTTSCLDESSEMDQLHELRELIGHKKAALAGPSGVGKSSLTNRLVPDAEMETGEISKKSYRGRHTTRHVEIFPIGDGYLFDTPGFTSFDPKGITEEELGGLFPEFRNLGPCKFNNCMHLKEPECGVREALTRGEVSLSRYESYKALLEKIRLDKKY